MDGTTRRSDAERMKYFHRTSVLPDAVMTQAAAFFGARLTPAGEAPRRRLFSGSLGALTVTAVPEGGHNTLVTVVTDQPTESEIDKLAKHFLGTVHVLAEPRVRAPRRLLSPGSDIRHGLPPAAPRRAFLRAVHRHVDGDGEGGRKSGRTLSAH